MTSESSQIESNIINYYSELFTSQLPSSRDISIITDLISPSVTDVMNEKLNLPFSEEVGKALFDLNPNKAPGSDGFMVFFFQKEWDTVEKDVTVVVLGILNQGELLVHWNPTIITLIPKSKDTVSMKDYRPLSLCNVTYKIIARALTNKLKNIMGNCWGYT